MATTKVTRTYVQLLQPGDLVPAVSTDPGIRVESADPCPASLYRFLYQEVGRAYHWIDRREWTDGEIEAHVGQERVSIWVLLEEAAIAGFFELVRHEDQSIEIAYFGLLPEFVGRGLGRHLLTTATTQAWHMGAHRVWLHTCTLDHPAALPNYLARGFKEFKRETYSVETEA